ncbi:MAG TPA: hypothetical protein VM366_14615 [Anaerolineae bacterium]|nr:hypothetical protein [Anaerolineae bacterium]
MLMRALQKLNIGIDRGEVFPASRIKPDVRDILLIKGIIAPVNAPPITALSEFVDVAERLVAAGIKTPAELIEAKAVEGLTAKELAAWQCTAVAALSVKPSCGCNRR